MQSPYRWCYEDRLVVDSDDAPGGVIAHFADGNEEIIHANRYILRVFECDTVDEFLELTKGSFRRFVHEDDLDAAEHSIWGQVRTHGGFDHVYYRVRTKTGRVATVSEYGRLIDGAKDGRPVFYALIAEVTPEVSVDWLTGLPGMRRFHELARMGSQALFNFGERPIVLALDIMGMKDYNTRYGRDAGDKLLRAFADVLRRHFGSEAASRFAEDHFYAYSTDRGIEERVEAVFADLRALDIERVPPVRAGAYACDPHDDVVTVGFDRAKAACDLDRKTWQSHLTWFTDEMRTAAHLRMHVLESLDQAIEQGWIRPYYQAVVRSSTGDICNEEALARWEDPEYGSLLPNQFIPDLEEAGELYKLDLHIVDCVIADMRAKQEHGVPIVPVSINFSLRDLVQLDLTKEIARRADDAGLPHSLLRIELTESVASSDHAFLRSQIDAMHEAGFEVWMDDFGSGYSSLNTLQEFNFDLIKLDMGFLRSAEVEKSHVILAGVVQAAAKLGVGTLTEGVETEEQARFLADIGCDMLQGYFYARPNSIDDIVGHAGDSDDIRRESFEEARYWNDVSLVSFTDLAERDDAGEGWVPLSESPIAVLEERNGSWRILRANDSYIDFLTNAGLLAETYSSLRAMPISNDELDPEFYVATSRSLCSHTWERVFGHTEFGSGFQFYVRHLTSSRDANAFMVSAVPTMLGSGLGLYGDVPVGYAVFRVILNEAGDEVVDAEYVYANNEYCEWGGFQLDEIIGKSFLEVARDAAHFWFSYCYQATVLGKRIHDIVFSPETGHWLSFNITPSLVDGCCVFAFTLADDERHVREELRMGLDTSELIIRIANALNIETDYNVAMNTMLEEMSRVIRPDRLYIFERGERTTSNTFEWCAEGVEPQIDTLQSLDNSEFDTWEELLARDPVVIIPDVEELRDSDERMYRQLTRQGITHLLAVPFYSGNQLLGYLGADNYMLEEDLDSVRLLQTVASFVSARIVNQRLIDALEQMGTHDELTGMLNRRGIDIAVRAYLEAHEGEPFALALMDVDDFKLVNDVYGHDMGDAGLCVIARCVEEAFPTGSIVGRNGGDEFMALVPGDESWHMGEYIESMLEGGFSFEDGDTQCMMTLSVGYVLVPRQADTLRAAYTMADAALYTAKLEGKSRCFRYRPSMEMQYRSEAGFTPRDVVESLPGAIVAHRPDDGGILFVNDEMVELLECDDVDDLMAYTGGVFSGVAHPDDRDWVRKAMVTGQTSSVEFRVLTKQGNVRRVANTGRLTQVDGVGAVIYELLVVIA